MSAQESGEQLAEDVAAIVVKRGKVTIVGAGPIGTACGMTLAQKGMCICQCVCWSSL